MDENQAGEETGGAVVAETVVETAVVTKGKKKTTSGNLIADVAQEVENLNKQKALNLAAQLAEQIDTNYFKLGGVLKLIFDQSWFEGAESFDVFVYERFGMKSRKARYLMDIYTELVTKNIPWEKVAHLGWTKLKDLAKVLTAENIDEWVAKAEIATVIELQAMLKATAPADGSAPPTTVDDVKTMKFKLKADQVETVQEALNKAKAEAGTEFDNVALEMICTGFLGGSVEVATKEVDLKALFAQVGWETVLMTFGEVFPEINIDVGAEDPNAAAGGDTPEANSDAA